MKQETVIDAAAYTALCSPVATVVSTTHLHPGKQVSEVPSASVLPRPVQYRLVGALAHPYHHQRAMSSDSQG